MQGQTGVQAPKDTGPKESYVEAMAGAAGVLVGGMIELLARLELLEKQMSAVGVLLGQIGAHHPRCVQKFLAVGKVPDHDGPCSESVLESVLERVD